MGYEILPLAKGCCKYGKECEFINVIACDDCLEADNKKAVEKRYSGMAFQEVILDEIDQTKKLDNATKILSCPEKDSPNIPFTEISYWEALWKIELAEATRLKHHYREKLKSAQSLYFRYLAATKTLERLRDN